MILISDRVKGKGKGERKFSPLPPLPFPLSPSLLVSRGRAVLHLQRGLRRGEAGDGHAERRAGDVVEADEVAEGYRARLAAVLAADADLEAGLRRAPALRADLHQLADAVAVQDLERVVGQNLHLDVLREEAARIVARQAEGGLGEIVRAEGEEVCVLGDLVGC